MRNGFTLIEVLVALVLFEIGMLALTASSGVAARNLAQAQRRNRARELAAARVEQLRARACDAPESGTATASAGFTEYWSVGVSGSRREIRDSVTLVQPGGSSTSVIARASVICAP